MKTNYTDAQLKENQLFLSQLAKTFPTVEYAMTEIVNLSSIMALPKPISASDSMDRMLENSPLIPRYDFPRVWINTVLTTNCIKMVMS